MMADLPHILVIDDDTRLRDLLRKYLSDNGYFVDAARDSAEARAKLKGLTFDAIILDLMMPNENGLDFAAALRRTSTVPILMLTAMGEPEDRINGLERGADDYLTKPFEPRELLLRLRNLLRRSQPADEGASGELRLGDCRFDLGREELFRGPEPVRLTDAERRLLRTLADSAGSAVSRDALSEAVGADGGSRSVDVHVTRLRRKIEANPRTPRYLQTVRGKGYALWPD